MSNEQPWKWWVANFSIPLAVMVVGIGTWYIQYLQYTKNLNEQKAQWQQENAANLKEAKDQIDKLNQMLAQRDAVIARQKMELDKVASAKPVKVPDFASFKFDPDKYITHSDLLSPVEQTWDEKVWAFVSDYWKYLLPWAVILVIGAIAKNR